MNFLKQHAYQQKPRLKSGLFYFDRQLLRKSKKSLLIGLDEAGRGPLAGPVVACAAFVPEKAASILTDVNDSKKISEKKRQDLFLQMIELGVKYSFAFASPREIDATDILSASLNSMKKAAYLLVKSLSVSPLEVLFIVDGPHKMRNFNLDQLAVIDGDAKSQSVAAASIFAKTIRDRWMNRIDKDFPVYGFSSHKGYGTVAHLKAIETFGPCLWHRRTFAPLRKICAR